MDPVSHAAFSRIIWGAIARDPPVRGAIAAAVLGGLSPDIDAILMPTGWDRYLRFHEVGTHTIVGAAICAALTAILVRAFARRSAYRTLAFAAFAGACSHVLLDLVSGARLRLAWPVIDGHVSIPLVAMADPWLLALCVVGALSVLGARGRQQLAAVGAAVAIAAFLLLKGVFAVEAVAAYRRAIAHAPARPTMREVEAQWASLRRWNVFDRTTTEVRHWRATAGEDRAELAFSWPASDRPSIVAASRSLSTVQNFLRAHDLGFAVALPQADGSTWVFWSDIRYCWNAVEPGAPQSDIVVAAPTGTGRLACALWFGGELDARGHPIRELVKVGSVTQRRAPRR